MRHPAAPRSTAAMPRGATSIATTSSSTTTTTATSCCANVRYASTPRSGAVPVLLSLVWFCAARF